MRANLCRTLSLLCLGATLTLILFSREVDIDEAYWRRKALAIADRTVAEPTTVVTSAAGQTSTVNVVVPVDLSGLNMRTAGLIEGVRQRLIPPSKSKYQLEWKNKTFFAQYKQDQLIANIFKKKRGGFFIEAGALDGEYLSNTLYLERSLGWTGVLVEPGPASFKKLINKHRKAYLLQAGLSPSEEAVELKLNTGGKDAALYKFHLDQGTVSKKLTTVPCFPLFTVLQAMGSPTVDVLSLDLEGAELKVLQSVPWSEVRVRLLLVEINHISNGLRVIKSYMTRQGFKYLKSIGVDLIFYNPVLASDMLLSW